jgi:hypothetical protein
MALTLRDEILVVCAYESRTYAKHLMTAVIALRKALGNTRPVDEAEFALMLRKMVDLDDLLEPWMVQEIQRNRRLKFYIVAEISGRNPLLFHFKLTPKGWRKQRDLLEMLRKMDGGWKPLKKK